VLGTKELRTTSNKLESVRKSQELKIFSSRKHERWKARKGMVYFMNNPAVVRLGQMLTTNYGPQTTDNRLFDFKLNQLINSLKLRSNMKPQFSKSNLKAWK
jgi:hypothetical protein